MMEALGTNIIFIFLLTIVASFIQRTTGFGFGIFMMTVLHFFMPSYGEATALSGLLAISTSFFVAIRMRRMISWKRLWLIFLVFVLVSAFAIHTLASMNDTSLRVILGIVLLLLSLYFLFFNSKVKLRPTKGTQIGAGLVSGLLGGFSGMQGPPAVLYFISSEPDQHHYMAMISAYFVLGNSAMTLFRAGNGFVTPLVIKCFLICLAAVGIGITIGKKVYDRIPADKFRKVVYAYIGISGLIVTISSIF